MAKHGAGQRGGFSGQSRHLTRVSFLFFSRVHTLHRRKTDLEEFDPIISRQ